MSITSKFVSFKKKVIQIIEENEPVDAYLKIAKLDDYDKNDPTKKIKVGKKNALGIYLLYAKHSVQYDMDLHANNIVLYMDQIKANIKKVRDAHKKN